MVRRDVWWSQSLLQCGALVERRAVAQRFVRTSILLADYLPGQMSPDLQRLAALPSGSAPTSNRPSRRGCPASREGGGRARDRREAYRAGAKFVDVSWFDPHS